MHIKALRTLCIINIACAKLYVASNGCLWGFTWNVEFQEYVFVGDLGKEELKCYIKFSTPPPPLDVVSRYRDLQLQVGVNYSYLLIWDLEAFPNLDV